MSLNTTHLINSVVQCHFKSGSYPLSQNLKEVADDIASQYKADSDQVKALTKIFESKGTPIGALKARIEKVRTDIKEKGLPDQVATGHLYVQRKDIAEIQTIFDEGERDLLILKDDVRKAWPAMVKAARTAKGGLAAYVNWPTVEDFLAPYKMELRWMAQPQAIPAGVLSAMAQETAARVAAESQKATEERLRAAHIGPVREILKSVSDMVDSYSKGKERFRQEPFDNLREAAERLSDLNWLKLPEIGSLCDVLADAGKINIVSASEDERKAQVDKVKQVHKAMASTVKKLEADLGI